MGTHKSVGGAETVGVGGLNLLMKKDQHRANLYSQSVQQAINKPCMMCVVNFFFALSQLQRVEWEWPGRREPDDEHSPAS